MSLTCNMGCGFELEDTRTFKPSEEQQQFIDFAKQGYNVLVDACIGSGKTSVIQHLCGDPYLGNKSILYLTYNALLRQDAKAKLGVYGNVEVYNYHSFANSLLGGGIHPSVQIQKYLELYEIGGGVSPRGYDLLIIDEYQDIDYYRSRLLKTIKECNPKIQILAVGDMDQRVRDDSSIDIKEFITEFLGEYKKVTFTKCFRISEDLANKLGDVWGKEIKGVNPDCVVEFLTADKIYDVLATADVKDVMCLGENKRDRDRLLNKLERNLPNKYNKKTVYASIRDGEDTESQKKNAKNCAIFTTFDSCKGLERNICVICSWSLDYWSRRNSKPLADYNILKNIFCVAASRGKRRIIFMQSEKDLLSYEDLKSDPTNKVKKIWGKCSIGEAFEHKFTESIDYCYGLLKVDQIDSSEDSDTIEIQMNDELIDLSPCINRYLKHSYFSDWNVGSDILMYYFIHNREKYAHEKSFGKTIEDEVGSLNPEDLILWLCSVELGQERYKTQVNKPFVSKVQEHLIHERLRLELNKDEIVQCESEIKYNCGLTLIGLCDVVRQDSIWNLKFSKNLSKESFLVCAMHMVAQGKKKGRLWNVKTGELWEISIPDVDLFMRGALSTITKNKETDGLYSVV